MSIARNDRLDRLLAVALFLVLVAALLSVTFGAGYTLFTQQRDQAVSVSRLIEQIRVVVDRQQTITEGLAAIDQQKLLDTVYMTATNAAVAVATLQDKITTLAAVTGTQMRRISVADGSGASGRVSIQVQLTGNLDQLSSFLVGVENHRPLLTLEKISVNRLRSRRLRGTGNGVGRQQFAGLMTLSAALRIRGADGN
ncbi:MAG: hypothetical protein IH996_05880 [Proteobacteria bacterium]|nr:hypothetical protein [Pseudomonadota bacterium]